MSLPFHNQVRLDGFEFPDAQFTVLLAAGIDNTSVGLAVTQDTSAPNQVKLAGDGDPILGKLKQVEVRTIEGQTVGTVSFAFIDALPVKAGLTGGQAVVVGSHVCGAGAGQIRAAVSGTDASYTPYSPRVWEVRSDGTAVVSKIA